MRSSDIAALPLAERKQMAVRERLRGLGKVDIVKAWYAAEEPFDLKPDEDAIRQRWDLSKSLFLERKTYAETVDGLMAAFDISIAQARVDIRNMRHVFGPLDEVPKAAHRALAIEMAKAAYNVCKGEKDGAGMAKATAVYITASGVDKDDAERVDIEKLMKERTYVEVMDADTRNLLLNFLKMSGGVVDATALFAQMQGVQGSPEFTDYELLPNANTE